MKRHHLTPVLLAAVYWQGAAGAGAQNAGVNLEQAEGVKRRQAAGQLLKDAALQGGGTAEMFAGEATDLGPQSILQIKPRRELFDVILDSQFFHTSNMFLEEDAGGVHPTSATLLVSTMEAAFAPASIPYGQGRLAPRAGFRYQWFNYGLGQASRHLGDFDFDSQTVFGELRYTFGEHWAANFGFDWNVLYAHTPAYFDYPQTYRAYVPRWGLERRFALSESKVFTVAYSGNLSYTDTPMNPQRDINNRTDQALLVSYAHALTPKILVQPYYRFQFTHYSHYPGPKQRNDLLNTFGLGLNYFFNDRFGVRAFANYDIKESSAPDVADYRKFDAGGGLNLFFRF